jgi:MoxR-like ATPase
MVRRIYIDDLVKRYIALLVEASRHHPQVYLGASPRASLALFRGAQARALLNGRDFVLPDDIKALAEPVLAHRLVLVSSLQSQDRHAKSNVVRDIVAKVPVPGAAPGH